VVILDIQMPRVTGHGVLAHLRADPAIGHIPIVMLTASREEAILMRSYEDGANAYVVKPIRFQEFFDAVQQLGVFWAVLNVSPERC
jgi:CheY-like chemotaxis protein